MKYRYLIMLLFGMTLTSAAGQVAEEDVYRSRVSSLDNTLKTLYEVISGEKGEARDWDLFLYLFHPDAKLIPTGIDGEGRAACRFMSPAEYIDSSGKWLEENGFFEKEVHRTTETFGPVTQVFSTYESYHSAKDAAPFVRGINSIQLLFDGVRWWVVNIYWAAEKPGLSIPEKYLPDE